MQNTFTLIRAARLCRVLPLAVFFLISQCCIAQGYGISVTLLHQPCNNDGILVAYDSTGIPPLTFRWYVNGTTDTFVSNSNYDTLYNYSGSYVYVSAGTSSAYYAGSPPFTFVDSTTSAVCPALGTAKATVSGGTPPFSYQWLNSSNVVVSTSNPAQLPAGNYQIIITDSAGCVYGYYNTGNHSGQNYEGVRIGNVSSISFTVKTDTANCTNGVAAVTTLSGGYQPYSYLWNNGATTDSITGLTTGYYYVTVTDSLGCYNTAYGYVSQAIAITVNATPTPATCLEDNGQAIAFGSGGLPPYSYLWSNGQTTQGISSLIAGLYTVTVSDSNHCIGASYAEVTASTPITVVYSSTPTLCPGPTGTASILISGGTPPYTVGWSTYPSQTTTTATGLAQGFYNFLVTDSVGCVRSGTVYVPPISIITGYMEESDALCTAANGASELLVTSGTSPYQYHWSNGATTSSITNVVAGVYSCTVTDSLNCTLTKSAVVQVATDITLGLNSAQATCIFVSDGSITAVPSGGTAPYSYYWSNGDTTSTASGLAHGYYSVYISDAVGCVQSAWTDLPYNPYNDSCYCTITGTVYDDVNSNCAIDSGEGGIQNIMMHLGSMGYSFTDANGVYSFLAPTGTYTLSEVVQYYYPLSPCQNNNIPVSVTAASGCVIGNNIANLVNPIHDVSIHTCSYNSAIPGFTYKQKVVVENNGTVTEDSIQLGYANDGQLMLTGETPSLFVQQDAAQFPNWYSIIDSFPPLAPAARQVFEVDYLVPTNIPLNTTLTFNDTDAYTYPISNWLHDYTPWNNVSSYQTTVIGSFDPNEKEVSPIGTGLQGYISTSDSVLTYTVRFQNTGTYLAQNITVIDSLSKNLDITTLRPGYSNFTYTTSADDSGNAKFTFNNINLPDSVLQPNASTCILMYTIHQKPGLTAGTQIKSPAYVYFDYNKPVKTNTALNTIKSLTGIAQVKPDAFGFLLYPNPANSKVSLLINSHETDKQCTLKVYNLLGDVLQQSIVGIAEGKNILSTDVSNLSSGLYFVELSDANYSVTEKLSLIR